VILLFHGEPEEARRVIAGQDWIGAVIAAHAPDDRPQDLARAGEPHLLTVGRDGKHLGLAEIIPPRAAGSRAGLKAARAVPLGPEVRADPAARPVEAVYLQRIAEEDLLGKLPRRPIPDGDRFAGTAACRPCHAAAYRIWAGTAHAHAWRTLSGAGHDRDPDCVGCHVVGLEYEGGFQSATQSPQLANVGCESCHQAAGRHAASPSTVRPPRAGAASCAACHIPEHSPGFAFARCWPKIRH
jgi:hypothetical protein